MLPGNENLVDPVRVHVYDFEPEAMIREEIRLPGDVAEVVQDEAAYGVDPWERLIRRYVNAQPVEDVVDRRMGIHQPGTVLALGHDRDLQGVFPDLADEGFQDVRRGDDALDVAILVDDDGDLVSGFLERAQEGHG